MPATELTDAELVAACREGDREAFARIVERYQALLCSLAYSATGDLGGSEDVAQEVFVIAWREMGTLSAPEKLRPWLCGILRHRVGRMRRRDGREPVRGAGSIEEAGPLTSGEEPAPEQAIAAEERAMLWQALAGVPEIYREPLILYYREHRSIEHVAVALDLTEDAVKQRLSRGRKILQEQVLARVEGALARSAPGRMFTAGVLAALPALMPSAKALGAGSVAMKGGLLAKLVGLGALLTALGGVVNSYFGLRTSLDQAHTPDERRATKRIFAVLVGAYLALGASMFGLRAVALRWSEGAVGLAVLSQVLVAAFIVWLPVWLIATLRTARTLRSRERALHPELFRDEAVAGAGEYRSRARFCGIPLVHIRFVSPDETSKPVVAWIAIGDRAYGVLFAMGGVAVGGISVGVFSVGLLAIGVVGIGAISISDVGVGGIATGTVAVGWWAQAWLSALGWTGASSDGFAIAGHWARGAIALAPHANDDLVRQVMAHPHAKRDALIWLGLLLGLTIGPIAWYARSVRARRRRMANR